MAQIGSDKFRRGYSVEGRIISRSARFVDLMRESLRKRIDQYGPW